MDNEKKELAPLMKKAAECFKDFGHTPIWSSENYTDELGTFCEEMIEKILNDTISLEEKKKLYRIFAPTCDWDDSVGNIDLGNEIFTLLDKMYRNEVLNK